jgi:26S proteasome regulatory subunit N2
MSFPPGATLGPFSSIYNEVLAAQHPNLIKAALTSLVSSEALSEDETFPERELAALLASKVYYHLQEYNESMVFALGAGRLLNLDNGGEFEETIIGRSS